MPGNAGECDEQPPARSLWRSHFLPSVTAHGEFETGTGPERFILRFRFFLSAVKTPKETRAPRKDFGHS